MEILVSFLIISNILVGLLWLKDGFKKRYEINKLKQALADSKHTVKKEDEVITKLTVDNSKLRIQLNKELDLNNNLRLENQRYYEYIQNVFGGTNYE